MYKFLVNGYLWRVKVVASDSSMLIDRTNTLRVATTDPYTRCIYLSNQVRGEFCKKVLLHELGHCVMYSYGLLAEIHQFASPEYWIEAEEWVCNFLADYGQKIFSIMYDMLGNDAWLYVPQELERLVS